MKINKYLQEKQPSLKNEYLEYLSTGAAITLPEENVELLMNDIYKSDYLFFIERRGKIWILETISGYRFPAYHLPDPEYVIGDEVVYSYPYAKSRDYVFNFPENRAQFYNKYYRKYDSDIEFNLNYLEDASGSLYKGETLHFYQPIRFKTPHTNGAAAAIVLRGGDSFVFFMSDFEIVSAQELNNDDEFMESISHLYIELEEILDNPNATYAEYVACIEKHGARDIFFPNKKGNLLLFQ